MEQIKIFQNPAFGEVRVSKSKSGDPLFCIADVCSAIGINNPRMVKNRLDQDDVSQTDTIDNLGRIQQVTYVTESGLYDVIIRSDSPNAKPFRKWVTSEVLPAIRKTGGYMVANDDESQEEILARAYLIAKETIERQSKKIKEQAPKVLFAEAVETSNRSCLIAELAKVITQNGYEIGQNRLFKWLRDTGYLGKHGEYYNVPTQRAMEMGLFEIKKTTIVKPDGITMVQTTSKVSGKGQIYFVNKFLSKKNAN